MRGKFSDHLRSNAVGYVALFFVFTGGAYALEGKNTVNSGDIKKRAVRSGDLDRRAVTAAKLARRSVTAAKLRAGAVGSVAVADDSLTGEDIAEETLSGVPVKLSGPAGGDLTGSYPNPQIAQSAVDSGKVANESLAAVDIDDDAVGATEPAVANDEIDDGGVDAQDVANESLRGADILNGSLGGADIGVNEIGVDEPTVAGEDDIADGTIDIEDIDEDGLDADSVDGNETAYVPISAVAGGAVPSFAAEQRLDAGCDAGGEAFMTVTNESSKDAVSFVDDGSGTPTIEPLAPGAESSQVGATDPDLITWHVGTVLAGPGLPSSATYVIGVDESGPDCQFFIRGTYVNQP